MAEIKEIPLTPLGIYGIMGTSMIHIATYNLTDPNMRNEVINEILTELATKDVVILGSTLVYTDGYDGFRIL
ncbi:MAG: hypothetical protein QXX57_04985 [Nitrososphaerota archaeon]